MKRYFFITLLATIICSTTGESANLNVCPSGCTYSTIKEAIDVAVDGDTVLVAAGTYYLNEDIVIPEGVELSGEHWDVCILDLGGYFQIQLSSSTTITGFNIITPPNGRDMILALNATSPSVANNVIQGSQDAGNGIAAIFLDYSSGRIENNVIDGEHTGIRTRAANDSIVFNNIIVNNVHGLIDTDSSIFSMDYNNFWNNTNSPDIMDTNNFFADPRFVDADNDDYRLCSNLSLCIDAGHPDVAYNDVDASRNDIGADGGPDGVVLDITAICTVDNGTVGGNGGSGTDPVPGGLFHTCFIATAAYGTPMAEQVKILCLFRDEYLLTNSLGSRFVDFYYKYSPPIAGYIAQNEFLRKLVRICLWPFITLSLFMLEFSLLEKIGILIVLLLMSRGLVKTTLENRDRRHDNSQAR